jgi:hypothetical protein
VNIYKLAPSSTMSTRPSKFSGSAKVLKALQGFAAFMAYEDKVCQRPTMTAKAIENTMEMQFWVTPPTTILSAWPSSWSKVIDCLLDSTIKNSSKTALPPLLRAGKGGEDNLLRSANNPSGTVLVLKPPELHCLVGIGKKIVVGGPTGLKLSTSMLASRLS